MKNIKRPIIFTISTVAAIVFVVVLTRALLYSPASDLTVPLASPALAQATPTTTAPSATNATATANAVAPAPVVADTGLHPVRLSIPVLHVDASIQEVGLTAAGAMAVPTNFTDVGWYKYGVLPGQTGSAVIDGHVNDGLTFPAVFADLSQLNTGDDIYVTMSDGTTLHFVMTGSQAYDKNSPTGGIFNDDSGKLLKLITCTGTWLQLLKTHDQRLVVTAVLQP